MYKQKSAAGSGSPPGRPCGYSNREHSCSQRADTNVRLTIRQNIFVCTSGSSKEIKSPLLPGSSHRFSSWYILKITY